MLTAMATRCRFDLHGPWSFQQQERRYDNPSTLKSASLDNICITLCYRTSRSLSSASLGVDARVEPLAMIEKRL